MHVLLLGRSDMNVNDIKKYATLMKELDLTALEISEDNKTVRLERTVSEVIREKPKDVQVVNSTSEKQDYISIKSPMVGVFYAAPAENAKPFVVSGDKVKKGQVLCIIEAMKLLNEITCDEDCTITEVCVANGQIVEFGTELFRIKR